MSTTADPPAARGTAELQLELPISADEAWEALTNPVHLERWFGDLFGNLEPGARSRFDFGDGDFFDVETLEVEPRSRIVYQWRFLGTGLTDRITWRVEPAGRGSRVTVTDEQPRRTEDGVKEMLEGWRDFTERLEGFAATGAATRYDWSREFGGGVRLAGSRERAWEVLFAEGAAERWLPFALRAEETGVEDGGDPSVLHISALALEAPEQVRFQVGAEGWLRPTRVRLELEERDGGTALSVTHLGWEEISGDMAEGRRQRRRFAGLWVKALERARTLAGAPE
ncbi:MAG TPA: SRPBCC family protein [Longimicrobium sp.]